MAKKKQTRQGSGQRSQPAPSGPKARKAPAARPVDLNRALSAAAVAGIVVGVATLPSYWVFGSGSPAAMFAVAGVALGLLAAGWVGVLASSATYALFAAIVYPPFFATSALQAAANAKDVAYWGDVMPQSFFVEFLAPLAKASDPRALGAAGVLVLGLGITTMCAALVFLLKQQLDLSRWVPAWARPVLSDDPRRLMSGTLLVVVVIALLSAGYGGTAPLREQAKLKLGPGEYSVDYDIYLRTYQLMGAGTNYYRALDESARGDRRLAKNYQTDKGYSHFGRPSWVPHPFAFSLWKTVGGGGPDGVVFTALLIAATGALLVGLGLERWLPPGAGVVAALFVFPWSWSIIGWEGLFLTDTWGGLFLLLSVGFLLCGLDYPAIGAGALASLCRLLYWPWSGLLVAGLVLRALLAKGEKRRALLIQAGVAAGAFGVVLGSFWLHWRAVSTKYAFLLPQGKTSGGFGMTFDFPSLGAALRRVNWASNFDVATYTHNLAYGTIIVVAALVFFGLAIALGPKERDDRLTYAVPLGYLAFWVLLLMFSNHSSQYWANEFMQMAVVGAAGLLLLPFKIPYLGMDVADPRAPATPRGPRAPRRRT